MRSFIDTYQLAQIEEKNIALVIKQSDANLSILNMNFLFSR